MLLLIVFGFIAGAGTAVSPCVLPVLPVVLAAGASGGRRRPLGIVAGLVASFTFSTVALVYLISALGLPADLLRKVAIAVLLGFGITLLIPPLAARVEGYVSRFAGGRGVRRSGDGFWSGTLVGASLGLVYAPCAGPILAGVITVSASQSFTVGRLLVALSYGLGSAVVLYLLMLGGRKMTSRLARRSGALQMGMGAIMVLVAVLMAGNYDIKFENTIAHDAPAFLVDPTKGLEAQSSVHKQLVALKGGHTNALGRAVASAQASDSGGGGSTPRRASAGGQPETRLHLPVLGHAPEFHDTQQWFNTPGDRPITLASLRGKVVVVDFWTYSCINCIRTLPYLKAWYATYHSHGLEIIGVHTPEFAFEHIASNVASAIQDDGLRYPVVQDNSSATFEAYGAEYWPSEYFIDAHGNVRHAHFGEGDYATDEHVIRTLLAEGGDATTEHANTGGVITATSDTTPESYLGANRAERFTNGKVTDSPQNFRTPRAPGPNELAYAGRWNIGREAAISEGGSLMLNFKAKHVYLVMGGDGVHHVRVLLDGMPIPPSDEGADVHEGAVSPSSERLYTLVSLPSQQRHTLTLQPQAGTVLYDFTFG